MLHDDDDKKHGIADHSLLHEANHFGGIGKNHEAFHDHSRIHSAMHLGSSIKNPLSPFHDDDDD